jgi:ketosteroid isomerase-like protein
MTHVNEYFGIPPTNKRIENQIVWIMEFEAGKIIEIREYEKKNEYLKKQMKE